MKDIQQYVDQHLEFARKMLEMGHFTPHVATFDKAGQMSLGLIFADSREGMIQAVRKLVQEAGADLCLVAHEAWLASCAKDDYSGVPASQRPDRIDALFVFGETRDGETGFAALGVKEGKGRRTTFPIREDEKMTDAVCTWNIFERTQH